MAQCHLTKTTKSKVTKNHLIQSSVNSLLKILIRLWSTEASSCGINPLSYGIKLSEKDDFPVDWILAVDELSFSLRETVYHLTTFVSILQCFNVTMHICCFLVSAKLCFILLSSQTRSIHFSQKNYQVRARSARAERVAERKLKRILRHNQRTGGSCASSIHHSRFRSISERKRWQRMKSIKAMLWRVSEYRYLI